MNSLRDDERRERERGERRIRENMLKMSISLRLSRLYPDVDYKWTRIDGSPNVNQRRVAFNNKSTFVSNALRPLSSIFFIHSMFYIRYMLYKMISVPRERRFQSSNRENRSWPGKV